ncbi:hypothetical protein HBH53_259140 [Parastagonospora nodorum]|nr:hypothetical protein HBH53_259140 [Parastagonospora nodorum]
MVPAGHVYAAYSAPLGILQHSVVCHWLAVAESTRAPSVWTDLSFCTRIIRNTWRTPIKRGSKVTTAREAFQSYRRFP